MSERETNNAYLRSLPDVCECGHGRLEHYDGHTVCLWNIVKGSEHCDCEQYEPKKVSDETR